MAKTFLITGVSSGFGRALAEAALSDGHAVAGTVRNDADRQKFEALGPGAHALVLDVTDTKAIAPAPLVRCIKALRVQITSMASESDSAPAKYAAPASPKL